MNRDGLTTASVCRRLLTCAVVLLAVDHAVLPTLRVAEAHRYESDALIRFENSDLFVIGPLTDYLRETPVGRRPRILFFGNSFVWGYGIDGEQTIPAMFQRLTPQARVFNLGVNGFESGNAYLMTKAVIDAIDRVYLFHIGGGAHPLLPQLIPVSPEDAARFGLRPRSASPAWLERVTGRWRLATASYRLQAAWFGTSTRQAIYLRKGAWVRSLMGRRAPSRGGEELPPAPVEQARWEAPVAAQAPDEAAQRGLASRHPLLWDYARLLAAHHTRGVIISGVHGTGPIEREDLRQLNAMFAPYVVFGALELPESWFLDPVHLTPSGCRGVAELLYRDTA